jgi:predicted CoA-substrate-specific enzyme activase
MNIVAGVDIGAGTAKAIILVSREVISSAVMPSGYDTLETAHKVIYEACEKGQVLFSDLEKIIATGYSRSIVPFATRTVTEIMCHAKGASFLIPNTRTVIDIGCQDSKAIKMDGQGRVTNFVMNDKCAAGTGRFIEVMAHTLGLSIEEVGPLSLTSKNPCEISSTCTVFAETEIVTQRAKGKAREDLIAGALRSIARRVGILASSIGLADVVVFSGGVAKNEGVKKALEEATGLDIQVPEDPQIVGALGAALFAADHLERTGGSICRDNDLRR